MSGPIYFCSGLLGDPALTVICSNNTVSWPVFNMLHGHLRGMWELSSLVPRPPPSFVIQFAFGIINGSGRAAKNGEVPM